MEPTSLEDSFNQPARRGNVSVCEVGEQLWLPTPDSKTLSELVASIFTRPLDCFPESLDLIITSVRG